MHGVEGTDTAQLIEHCGPGNYFTKTTLERFGQIGIFPVLWLRPHILRPHCSLDTDQSFFSQRPFASELRFPEADSSAVR